ncbi:indole-3-glycerol-phosphate synthase [Kibdelosporangium phytohabitans]|uniref:indole-3-glycerol-phosphate synthase n=1 Tax=Kibdelosporangium phytohabitans TaxID=860235 RepID=A0A0N9HZS6_9PSEU|nr:indole-3-glycerol-phosphate synthase [Kibdelosporangium phytohabitans]ALG09241.1 indole-3-glycerol phosphate synthase [Kibdelosporangium phytohabitans]MBE1469520.1 indole-3-glycerol phosphate synthase [Kibdelosporangium phytohabitans]
MTTANRFTRTLLEAPTPVIAEVKPRTGDGNDLLRGRSAAAIALEYAAAGAACLSVVTGRWFGGSVDLLRTVASATGLPVLQKDFIIREKQLETARALGASAVLLTARLLTASSLRRMSGQALSLGLTPFVEVTDEEEIDAVPHPQDSVIAVNNKNIEQRELDAGELGRSLRLLPAVRATGTPCPVSASGIDTPVQAAALLDAGYAGLLVGTTLLRAANVDEWLGALR